MKADSMKKLNKTLLYLALLVAASLACGQSVKSEVTMHTNKATATLENHRSFVVTADALNVRECAGEGCDPVGLLSRGDTVICTEWAVAKDGGLWCKHELGWSNTKWLQ